MPSVVEPRWYGDEGIYQTVALALNKGRILYSGIWDNKPPLLYYIYAFLGADQFLVRLVSLVFGIITIFVFYLIAQKLLKNKFAIVFSTIFFSFFFGSPIIEGNIANAENFMLLPIILAFYLVINSTSKNKSKIFIAGVLLSLAFLTKIVAIFDFSALFLFLIISKFIDNKKTEKSKFFKRISQSIKQQYLLIISFIAPFLIVVFYFQTKGSFHDFWRAIFSQNVGYVGVENTFIIPMGLLYLKIVILIAGLFLIIKYGSVLNKNGLLIFLWFAFSFFSAFFSARPYTHYLIMLLPAFSLFLGYLLENPKLLKITLPIFLLAAFLIRKDFDFYKRTIPYYANYLEFLSGKNVDDYQRFFDSNTPRDYDLARFINLKTTKDEDIFLWTDSAQIYALSNKIPPGRYAVAYHITFYKDGISETKKVIDESSPKYIIQTKEDNSIKSFLSNYELKYEIEKAKIYERKY